MGNIIIYYVSTMQQYNIVAGNIILDQLRLVSGYPIHLSFKVVYCVALKCDYVFLHNMTDSRSGPLGLEAIVTKGKLYPC